MATLQRELSRISEVVVFPFNIPTISGFGAASGFNFLLQDRTEHFPSSNSASRRNDSWSGVQNGRSWPISLLPLIRTILKSKSNPHCEKARKLGVPINEVFEAMSTVLAGAYVNDFNRFGRLFRVFVQANAGYREKPSQIGDIYVRSRNHERDDSALHPLR